MGKEILRLVDEQIQRSQALRRAALEERPGVEAVPGPVITISRQLGSGGRRVADRLSERLGFSLWDKELIDAIARDADVNARIVESFDEKVVSEIEVLARTITGQREVGGFLYRRHLVRAILAIARHGSAIILGRGANFLLPGALNVRLVASEQARIDNLMEYGELSRQQALARIHESDRQRADFVRHTYDRDIDEPTAYDVVITTDNLGLDGTVEIVLAALRFRSNLGWRPGVG